MGGRGQKSVTYSSNGTYVMAYKKVSNLSKKVPRSRHRRRRWWWRPEVGGDQPEDDHHVDDDDELQQQQEISKLFMTVCVNFTNVLLSAFSYEITLRSFFLLTDWLLNFLWKNIGQKGACKTSSFCASRFMMVLLAHSVKCTVWNLGLTSSWED